MLDDPAQERDGIEIGSAAGVHPLLARLEGAGWLASRWEQVDPRVAGRPPRRYYRLTGEGVAAARAALARAYRPRRALGPLAAES